MTERASYLPLCSGAAALATKGSDMPRKSATGNVRKICSCQKWKTCAHPWYLDFQRANVRYRDNLDHLIERHAGDFTAAKDEARRAIIAKLAGRDPKGLLPADDPTLAQLLTDYLHERPRVDQWQAPRILRTRIQGQPFGRWRLRAITTEIIRTFHRQRPRVQGNRDLGLLRAAFNWAIANGVIPSSPFRIENVPIIRLKREQARSRRLQPGEAERLLAVATGLLDMIHAGARDWHAAGRDSQPPVAAGALPAAGRDLPAGREDEERSTIDASRSRVCCARFSIGDAAIPPATSCHRTPTSSAMRSAGAAARLRPRGQSTLTRAGIRDLHFHDLRREAGSRWMDAGVPLATIQRWLGHANISQTSTYLGADLGGDEEAYAALRGADRPIRAIDAR